VRNVGRSHWAWLAVGLLFVCISGPFAWRSWRIWQHTSAADALLSKGDFALAAVCLESAANLSPRRADLQFRLGAALRRGGDLKRAEQHFSRAAELGWPASEIERQRSLARIQIGVTDGAEKLVSSLASEAVSDDVATEVYEALARGYLTAYRLPEATECIERWIEWQPDCAQARLWLGDVYQKIDRNDLAMDTYRKILDMNTDSVFVAPPPADEGATVEPFQRTESITSMARIRLARLLLYTSKVEEGRVVFQQCLAEDPENVNCLLGLAEAEIRLGMVEEAEKRLRAAMPLKMTDLQRATVLRELGSLQLQAGNYSEALPMLEECVRLVPRDSSGHYNLGLTLVRLGRTEEGKREIDYSTEVSKEVGRLLDITRALNSNPDNVHLRRELGVGMIKLGMDKEGVGWLRTALWIDPNDAECHRSLAEYYEKKGDLDLAAQHRRSIAQTSAPGVAEGPPSATGTSAPPLPSNATPVTP
jgi:tetratricopeptide (TPR) repeat protein